MKRLSERTIKKLGILIDVVLAFLAGYILFAIFETIPLGWIFAVAVVLAFVLGDLVIQLFLKLSRGLHEVRFGLVVGYSILILLVILLGAAGALLPNNLVGILTSSVFLGVRLVYFLTISVPLILLLDYLLQSGVIKELIGGRLVVNPPFDIESEKALHVVEKTIKNFLKLNIVEVERRCNEVREEYLAKWNAETGPTVEGTNIQRSAAIAEATPRFELWRPERITIAVLHPNIDSVNGGKAPQVTMVNVAAKESFISTLMKWVKRDKDGFYLVDPGTGNRLLDSLVESTIHEILHACGDLPPKHDGVVRQTWIGVKAVKPMLGRI